MQRCYTVVKAAFEAACQLTHLPPAAPARRLHGHSYTAQIRANLAADWGAFSGAEVEQLHQQLAATVGTLDHRLLNDFIKNPSDENIARWLNGRLGVPELRALELDIPKLGALNLDKVSIQSTADTGVDLDHSNNAHSWKRFYFAAAHRLPFVAAGHQCGRMHGHGFSLILHAEQSLLADEGAAGDGLQAQWALIEPLLNRTCLNNIPGLENPTSEHLCRWIWERLKPNFAALSWVSVFETASVGSHYDGADFRIWKAFNFEAAAALNAAPAQHILAGLHGHSYLARLHLQAPLDEVLGWTVDYGDVKQHFQATLEQLDHHDLSANASIGDGSTRAIAHYIKQQAAPQLPQLNRIDLYQSPGCGVVLSWADAPPALPI